MKSCLPILFVIAGLAACSQAAPDGTETEMTEREMPIETANPDKIEFETIRGEALPFESFAGQAVLVVNTASRCGYTPQYAGLQELHDTFKDRGFTVLGVPSNDFGGQEPGTESQIVEFCEINFGVEFPLTSKVSAIGAEQHMFWKEAKRVLGEKAEPKWNFHKVLVGPDGQFVQAYPSAVRPADTELIADIEAVLSDKS
ncbi:MAG: glutathione peroxidase [Pseudomonadota bacterium]